MNRSRRTLVAALAAWIAAAMVGTGAWAAKPPKRVVVWEFEWAPGLPAGVREQIGKNWAALLARHGFVEGRDIEITPYLTKWGDGSAQAEEIARKIVASRPALVVFRGVWQLAALQALTREIPLACYDCFDVDDLEQDTFESVRRPGGNVASVAQTALAVRDKRLEMLKEMVPGARRLGIVDQEPPAGKLSAEMKERSGRWRQANVGRLTRVAHRLGMEAVIVRVRADAPPAELARALHEARVEIVDLMGYTQGGLWAELIEARIAGSHPAGYGRDADTPGPLLSYVSMGYVEALAGIAARILRGEAPANIPMEGPREFRLAVNLRTARALGISVPASVLVRAHRVIE